MSDPDHGLDDAWLATLGVLYVEDDAATREQLARFLRRRVGRLSEAASGAEGLERFRAERPALVITDVEMPGMDGLAMADEIRRLDATVPIVVVTAFEAVDYLRRAIDVGIARFVSKPVDVAKLETALRACARRLRADALLAHERRRALDDARTHEREALGVLAGGMAHDFNNLLAVVLGNVSLASELAAPGSALRGRLDEAQVATEQAAELGRHLRTLAGDGALRLRPLAIDDTLRVALAGVLARCRTRLRLELPTELPAVPHDGALLGRVFTLLAENASEAMGGAGVLSVTGEVRDAGAEPHLQLTFRDGGPGIAPDALPRIFDAYFSTKPADGARSAGLGLALCQAIVRRHHGVLTAASPPGGGALFTLALPLGPPASRAHA